MKTILLIILILFAGRITNAQITITSADLPSAKDTFRYSSPSNDTLITNNYSKTGQNYTWDFSNLISHTQGVDKYELASATSYFLTFLLRPSEYGYKIADSYSLGTQKVQNIYNFFNKTSSAFSVDGMGFTFSSIPCAGVYSKIDKMFSLPMRYGNRDSNDFYLKISILGQFDYWKSGYRISTVDGWGKIITPYGTFNCLRIKSFIHEIDSVKSSLLPIPIGFPNDQVEYLWMTNGEKAPILLFTGTIVNSVFRPGMIRYRDNYKKSAIEPAPALTGLGIYPNPSDGCSLGLDFEIKKSGNTRIILSDITGRQVALLYNGFTTAGHFRNDFNITGKTSPKGMYLIDVIMPDSHLVKKIMIQ